MGEVLLWDKTTVSVPVGGTTALRTTRAGWAESETLEWEAWPALRGHQRDLIPWGPALGGMQARPPASGVCLRGGAPLRGDPVGAPAGGAEVKPHPGAGKRRAGVRVPFSVFSPKSNGHCTAG